VKKRSYLYKKFDLILASWESSYISDCFSQVYFIIHPNSSFHAWGPPQGFRKKLLSSFCFKSTHFDSPKWADFKYHIILWGYSDNKKDLQHSMEAWKKHFWSESSLSFCLKSLKVGLFDAESFPLSESIKTSMTLKAPPPSKIDFSLGTFKWDETFRICWY